jgi:hypothetical protein
VKIPGAQDAVINPLKLHGYLLSRSHALGRFKAPFFESLGYSASTWRRLDADLRAQHLSQDAVAGKPSPYGQKYEVRATLKGPSGRAAQVVSVWVVLADKEVPTFVTAYPGESR